MVYKYYSYLLKIQYCPNIILLKKTVKSKISQRNPINLVRDNKKYNMERKPVNKVIFRHLPLYSELRHQSKQSI